ncbi:MAG: zf-HC2 domain-containing protein [Nitrospirae bacterium]|nr:zf-HC2 domain-containing protein [Nitrospirota bacterium]
MSRWPRVTGTCRETAQNIGDYMERRLPLLHRVRIRLHLLTCPGCVAWLKSLQATMRAVSGLRARERAVNVPPHLRARIEEIFGSAGP